MQSEARRGSSRDLRPLARHRNAAASFGICGSYVPYIHIKPILYGEDDFVKRHYMVAVWGIVMIDFAKKKNLFLASILFACLLVGIAAGHGEAKTIKCQMRGSLAGPVRGGKQLITFSALFRNVSRHEYISRVNWVTVEVHGFFRGREEKYTRKVNVNWRFSPALEPGQRKALKIRFRRRVDPRRGMFPYDDVEIRVRNINFSRAS